MYDRKFQNKAQDQRNFRLVNSLRHVKKYYKYRNFHTVSQNSIRGNSIIIVTMKIALLICMLIGSSLAATTIELLNGDTRFRTLSNLLRQANLESTLMGGTFTIFAPTDDAFKQIPLDDLSAITRNRTILESILTYHVVPGNTLSSAIQNELVVTTVNGKGARFNVYSHNKKTTIQGAEIIEVDKTATNGVVHVIDSVMLPPDGSVVDYVSQDQNLTTLLSLVQQAGIANSLLKDGITVFAPTNAAFASLSQSQLTSVKSDSDLLARILTYHVVGSTQYSAGLWQRERLDTLDTGAQVVVHFRQHGQVIKINSGRVLMGDIGTTNGVVHVIDHVLLPPSGGGVVG